MILALAFTMLVACHGDRLHAPCDSPDDCTVPEGADAVCLPKPDEGYCTWECATDADCDGDDDPDDTWERVCASFEEEPGSYCFPACEEDGPEDAQCPPGFTCRSTGGGRDNRRVCFPVE